MTPILSFLLKANLIIILLYGFYFLFLRRDTFYGHIRWYLLISMLCSVIFPVINISNLLSESQAMIGVSQTIPDFDFVSYYLATQPQIEYAFNSAVALTIPWGLILMYGWLSVVIFMLGKRLFQFINIICFLRCYPRQRCGNGDVIAIDKNIQPFSFLGYIFLNPSLYTNDKLQEIVAHEQVHCRQGHTFDILMIELLTSVCWFNPAAWLFRRDLKQNIEFYTDRRMLLSGFDRKHYQYNLLHVSDYSYQIVNHFHFNNLKKRIIMMNKKDSPRIMAAKYLLVIPVLVAVFLTVQISGLQAGKTNEVKSIELNINTDNT